MSSDLQLVRRQVRVLAILSGAQRAAMAPITVGGLHTLAYFADALAPVWDLPILDGQLLKRRSGPFSPAVQADIDALVGRGLVEPSDVRHLKDEDGAWRLNANYQLNPPLANPVLDHAMTLREQGEEIRFIEEVVLAAAALGPDQIPSIVTADAAYGRSYVAAGRMVDVAGDVGIPNVSARVALRFGQLADPAIQLSPAELIHLYVRELNRRLTVAA